MGWRVELTGSAEKDLKKLGEVATRRILEFLRDRLAQSDDPRRLGEALKGTRFGELWKYRLGDYRIVCRIEDGALRILVVRLGHRSDVYR
jgi:mRNA interferase RelE/StbE